MELLAKAKLEDILYTDNGKGPYKTSKIGEKYEYHKGRTYKIFMTNVGWIELVEVDEDGNYTGYAITTTLFVKKYFVDNYLFIETVNGIYKFIPIN